MNGSPRTPWPHAGRWLSSLWAALAVAVCLTLAAGCQAKKKEEAAAPAPTAGPGGFGPGGGFGPPGGNASEPEEPIVPKPVPIENGTAALTPDNSRIGFIGTHVTPGGGEDPMARRGGFQKFQGTVKVDAASKTVAEIRVEIETGSVWTTQPGLTNHLQGPDFFDAREHPTATFVSTSIKPAEGGKYTVAGDLTLLGDTRPIEFPATITVDDAGLMITAGFTIDRTEFGMDKLQERVNSTVTIDVAVGEKTRVAGGGRGPMGPGGPGGFGGGPGGRPFDPEALFKERDKDGDGKLTGDEISDRMKENLAEIDGDKDGSVSLEEFQARMRAMAQRGFGGGGGPGGGFGPPGGGFGPPGGGRGPRPGGPGAAETDPPPEKKAPAGGEGAGAEPAFPAKAVSIEDGKAALSPENTTLGFVGSHVTPDGGPDPMARPGAFEKFTGQAEVDVESKSLKSVSVEIETASIKTAQAPLTTHLQGPDFFDVREYPTARFVSSSIAPAEKEGEFLVRGELTLLKTTKSIEFPARIVVDGDGLRLAAQFTIDRTEFGMDKLTDRVQSRVTIQVAVGK